MFNRGAPEPRRISGFSCQPARNPSDHPNGRSGSYHFRCRVPAIKRTREKRRTDREVSAVGSSLRDSLEPTDCAENSRRREDEFGDRTIPGAAFFARLAGNRGGVERRVIPYGEPREGAGM